MENQMLAKRLASVQASLREAVHGTYPVPKLIAVTKTHPASAIQPLSSLGVTDIGENRVQEIVDKLPDIKEKFHIHLIGRLQTNKVKYIINTVCMIQSLDRMSLALEIDKQAQRAGLSMPVLIQVSPAGEPQKGGIPPEEVRTFLKDVSRMPGLSVRGLMAVMPQSSDDNYLRGLFQNMRTLFDRLHDEAQDHIQMEELSMGMSSDYLIAAECGSTMVRLGSAIFGPRDYTVCQTEEQRNGNR